MSLHSQGLRWGSQHQSPSEAQRERITVTVSFDSTRKLNLEFIQLVSLVARSVFTERRYNRHTTGIQQLVTRAAPSN